jgi:Ni2+-binding GTPase involved in maturation of urease and hydrogenase
MHRVQLQSGYSDKLQIYVKEVTEGQKFSRKGNPSFQKAYTGCITVW